MAVLLMNGMVGEHKQGRAEDRQVSEVPRRDLEDGFTPGLTTSGVRWQWAKVEGPYGICFERWRLFIVLTTSPKAQA